VIEARLRVNELPTAHVEAGVRCSASSQAAENGCGRRRGALVDVSRLLGTVTPGATVTLSVPLACFARAPGLASVAGSFELRTEGRLSLSLTDVRFARVRQPVCRPAIEGLK